MFALLHVVYSLYQSYKSNRNKVVCKSRQLPDALIQLCRCTSLLELVEILKETIPHFFQNFTAIQCFTYTLSDAAVWKEFYSFEEIHTQFTRKDILNHAFKQQHVSGSDDLVKKNYIKEKDQVTLFSVQGICSSSATGLIFLVCGNKSHDSSADLETLQQHATACYARLDCQLSPHSDHCSKTTASLLSDELNRAPDASNMQIMLNSYLSKRTSSSLGCIFLVFEEMNQIICQVVGEKKLDFEICYPCFLETLDKVKENFEDERNMKADDGLFEEICRSGEPMHVQRTATHAKYIEQLSSLFGTDVTSALCIPVRESSTQRTIGIVCLCNKSDNYNSCDVESVDSIMSKAWTVLSSSLTLQKEKKARMECEAMLQIARNLFAHLDDMGMLLGEIIQEARSLTNAERCSVFLVDNATDELVAKVFDGIVSMDESLDPKQYDFENVREVRMPLDQGIAGQVATTGKTLNIADAYSHPLFYRGIDEATGFRTRNILCFPIKSTTGDIVGVSQLCNKIKGSCFTKYDEELAEKFAVFSGISIAHSLLYKTAQESDARTQLANELMTYHMKVEVEDISSNMPHGELTTKEFGPSFDKFLYPPRTLTSDLHVKACIWMYEDLGLISKFHIPMRTLVHFVLMVRKGYRDPPYHNWHHAFSVMHHAYLLAKNLDLRSKMSDVEVIALLTACICHDLDHRGTNNAFQTSSSSVLASLYSSDGSVLERHHFSQAMCILNTPGCNIFANMTRKAYSRTLDLVKHIILATDVASHLQILPQLEEMASNGIDLSSTDDRELLLAACMTACDLSDQTKDWYTTKDTAKLIYKEFFSQGDMEKRMGNRPELIHDRERACVPQLQINFMEHIALPVYRLLATLFDDYQEVHDRVVQNIARWRRVEEEFRSRGLPNTDSLDFLTDQFDRDVFDDIGDVGRSRTSFSDF